MSGNWVQKSRGQLFFSQSGYATLALICDDRDWSSRQLECIALWWMMEPLSFSNTKVITLNGITYDYKPPPTSGKLRLGEQTMLRCILQKGEWLARHCIAYLWCSAKEKIPCTGRGLWEWIRWHQWLCALLRKNIRGRSEIGICCSPFRSIIIVLPILI